MATITLQNVSARYHNESTSLLRPLAQSSNREYALAGCSLTVKDGETMVVLGPSGCGKSTLLRVVAGLMPLESGQVFFDGEDYTSRPPSERGIGMVFQSYALYPHLDSERNVGFFYWLRRRPPQEVSERVRITASVMGMGFQELLGRMPRTLSGGERQRVAMGRCITREPRVFLLDEPMSNLDAQLRTRTRTELRRLLVRFHVTTIYVTHDQHEALALGDRLAIMREGQIEQVDTYTELWLRPRNLFVAQFLRLEPLNLLPAEVKRGKLEMLGQRYPLDSRLRRALEDLGTVLVGLRPEHLRLGTAGPGPTGQVTLLEPAPERNLAYVHLDVAGTACQSQAPLAALPRVGEHSSIHLDLSQPLIFDASGERRWP